MKTDHKSSLKVQKPWDCFICVNARRGLDPEDLKENVSGGSGCNRVTGRGAHKSRMRLRDQPWRHCDKLCSASLWFDTCCQQGNAPRQSVGAATLAAARYGYLMLHRAVHTHRAHGLVAASSSVSAGGSPHLALHTGEGRLGGEECNHNYGDEMEEPLHPIQLNHSRTTPRM